MAQLGEDLGRLFEVGFNLGVLRALEAGAIPYPDQGQYRIALARLRLPALATALAERSGVADEQGRDVVRQWALYFLTRGLIGGLTFWQELAASFPPCPLTVRYLQMRFDSDNALGTVDGEEGELFDSFLRQMGVEDVGRRGHYSQRGHFLRADTLLLLDAGRDGWHLVTLDLSIFTVEAMRELKDLSRPATLRQLLASELRYARTRGQFTHLAIDTEPGQLPFAEGLECYYQAFIREDKESAKLIQAGSYAHSFACFLEEFSLLDQRPLTFHVFGYTDRSLNALTLTQADEAVLERCATLYQSKGSTSPDWGEERAKVLDTIIRHAARSFEAGGKEFLRALLATKPGVTEPITFRETLTGFTNTAGPVPAEIAERLGLEPPLSLQNAHAALIRRALAPSHPARILFLTGNPGIGKTSSLVSFLRDHRADGFLFLYVSPRTQVNRDLLDKVEKSMEGEEEVISLYSTASLIEAEGGHTHVVAYRSSSRMESFRLGPVQFVPDVVRGAPPARRNRLAHITDDEIAEASKPNRGVLASVSEGIYQLLKAGEARSIVATVSIQSLKRTNRGDTLSHLEKIFRDGYNERTHTILWERLRALAQRTRHLFIMVDEITGDEAGSAFLEGILDRLNKLGLLQEQSGFNTKIIVADASIVEPSVIQAHLASAEAERDKVYFRKAPPTVAALEESAFVFRTQPALVIGANSYPASLLNLMYRVYLEVTPLETVTSGEGVRNRLEQGICGDLLALLQRDEEETRQIIVYLQDKVRLGDLVTRIGEARQARGQSWQRHHDYLEIHASLSEEEKGRLNQAKDTVRVVFMTSSASRGLSFPQARHILVAIPGFAVEQNLMEIIQVIYRGRGLPKWDAMPKTLLFYLAEPIYYSREAGWERAVTERLLSLVSLLLILKVAIMTRLQGYGLVGTERVVMVPVGGKGISMVGDSFGGRMEGLLKALQRASRERPTDGGLREIHKRLSALLSRGEVLLLQDCYSYLQLMRAFEQEVVGRLGQGLDQGLTMPFPGRAYVEGSLLVVPLATRAVYERYHLSLLEQIRPMVEGNLAALLLAKAHDVEGMPESLRTQLWHAVELIKKLTPETLSRSQRVVGQMGHPELYYALPIWTFPAFASLATYFASAPEEPDGATFRDLLGQLVRVRYPTQAMLPIGTQYAEFPWLLFRSHSLVEMRQRLFTGGQILASSTFNVLNLILSRNIP